MWLLAKSSSCSSFFLGDGENSHKDERWRAQIECARLVLDRSATLLLTSSKAFHRYPNLASARENRDTVFCQMRRALDLIHFIVKEGVVDGITKFGLEMVDPNFVTEDQDGEMITSTVLRAIKYFEDSVEMMGLINENYREQLFRCLESIVERTQDFTDSAYTSHEHRQNIILLCERAKIDLGNLYVKMGSPSEAMKAIGDLSPQGSMEQAIRNLLKTTTELRLELQQTSLELAESLIRNFRQRGVEILSSLKNCAMSGDLDTLQQFTQERLAEHIDYVEDVAKLVRHVTWTDQAQVRAKHAQINCHIYGPQVGVAATTYCHDPHSKVAKDNFDTFCQMWKHLVDDVIQIAKQVANQTSQQRLGPPDGTHSPMAPPVIMTEPPRIVKQPATPTGPNSPYSPGPMRLDHGGGNGFQDLYLNSNTMGKFHKSVPDLTCLQSNQRPLVSEMMEPRGQYLDPKMAVGEINGMNEPRRHSTSGIMHPDGPHGGVYPFSNKYPRSPEEILDSYKDVENNEILKRAKKMAGYAEAMLNFTRGYGKVKTTQDLFTYAEYLAEETNLIYKVIRIFSYDVPSGEDKRMLMAIADNVPKHCGQLQMLIQSKTVGKAATFTKVDSIISETRTITNLILRVVEICYSNAKKYNLDFTNVTMEGKGDDPNSVAAAAAASDTS